MQNRAQTRKLLPTTRYEKLSNLSLCLRNQITAIIATKPKPVPTTVQMQKSIATAGARDEARAAEARRAPSNGVHRVVAFDSIQSGSGQSEGPG